ncbi:MAG: hypothetical protein JWM85_3422 [Acidimicrobiaceae bacterium]|nr:hypothetical protein [Acidimicrobiaceae bacterium]
MSIALPGPADVAAAARVADLLATASLVDLPLAPSRRAPGKADGPLHLAFLLSRAEAGGGAGALLEQADQLAALGVRVTVISHFPQPPWFALRADYIQVPFGEPIEDAVPTCDLVIAGHWEFVLPARRLGIAPVIHVEQGDFHLYDPVPAHVRRVVAASVRAAQATLALGGAATRALAERYGVSADEVPFAVDTEVFRPTGVSRDWPRPGSRARSAIVVGWDGPRTWSHDDARALVAALGDSHPAVRVVLVTSVRPDAVLPGEVLVAPSQEELARRYREADVCVSCSRDAASPLVPLKAMASGTPVVATATDGVLSRCEDEVDALVAPIGDVRGLVARVRRVLDDHALSERLSLAGQRTAERHAWSGRARELLGHYRAVIAAAPAAEYLGAGELCLEGMRLDRPGDLPLLRARLASCPTRELAIPVAQPVVPGHVLFRWRTVGSCKDREPGVTRVHLPARSDLPVCDSPYQEGIELLRRHRGVEALDCFVARCDRAGRNEQAALGRWIVLSLLSAKRPADAADLAVAFARDFPSHPDYLYLGVVAAMAAGRPVEVSGPLEGIRLLGHGARHEEWFEDPARLLTAHLAAA